MAYTAGIPTVQSAQGINPLDALIQGFQQGNAIQQLPQTLQNNQINQMLQQALLREKLMGLQELALDRQDPNRVIARQINQSLAVKQAIPNSGFLYDPTSAQAAAILGGPISQPRTVNIDPTNGVETQVSPRGGDLQGIMAGSTASPFVYNAAIPQAEAARLQTIANANEEYTLAPDAVRFRGGVEINRGLPKATTAAKLEVSKEGNEMVVRNSLTQEVVRREPLSQNEDIIKTDHGAFKYTPGQKGPATLIEGTAPTATKPAKPLPTKIANDIADAASAVDEMIKLKSYIDSDAVKAISGPARGRTFGSFPYNETAQKFAGVRGTSKQVIGKYLEGGVLKEADERKYEKIVPAITMLPNVQQNQSKELYGTLRSKIKRDIESYERAGYDMSGLRETLNKMEITLGSNASNAPSVSPAPPTTSADGKYEILNVR